MHDPYSIKFFELTFCSSSYKASPCRLGLYIWICRAHSGFSGTVNTHFAPATGCTLLGDPHVWVKRKAAPQIGCSILKERPVKCSLEEFFMFWLHPIKCLATKY